MCIKCLLLEVLAKREAEFTTVGEEALARGEAIHEELLGAAGTAQGSEPEDLGKQSVIANIELVRAQTRSVDADTILKLANAAKALYTTNLSTAGVIRTMEQLLYPAPPEAVVTRRNTDTQAEAPAAATEPEPEAPAAEESELPEAIQKEVARLRADGFEVDVVRLQL